MVTENLTDEHMVRVPLFGSAGLRNAISFFSSQAKGLETNFTEYSTIQHNTIRGDGP